MVTMMAAGQHQHNISIITASRFRRVPQIAQALSPSPAIVVAHHCLKPSLLTQGPFDANDQTIIPYQDSSGARAL
jgi:hypothetical protein